MIIIMIRIFIIIIIIIMIIIIIIIFIYITFTIPITSMDTFIPSCFSSNVSILFTTWNNYFFYLVVSR